MDEILIPFDIPAEGYATINWISFYNCYRWNGHRYVLDNELLYNSHFGDKVSSLIESRYKHLDSSFQGDFF